MEIGFSIKSKKFYEFLCVFYPAYLEAHRHKFYETDYIRVYISYELDDNNKILLNQFKISKDTKEKYVPVFISFPFEIQKMMVEKSSSKSCIPFLRSICVMESGGGFNWANTEEGSDFWDEVIDYKNFDIFFKKYPSMPRTDVPTNTPMPKKVFNDL